ncbi:Methyl-accepting chemotaxis protein (MCP) signalling domain-containing protein [Methylobacterium sp. 174MFSha1.1]|uniref:methyl-accepting chemotaxis protein n=1 Tax=Methylobacterium sp. 174MFSha1.1 TaxID=1502749 RepID=UPI0008EFD32A|nr:methyl-accepting chemotaxis protein [Methylobacterium sp. 174MFSha1.1]SFU75314.1 Methyl-accepting chemotaxis protein (MCP) signalling domain-containing protein [Methylobacterium sp. 174MFSha1.1]
MQIAVFPAPARSDLTALLLGAGAGVTVGAALWILGVVQPSSLILGGAYAGCGGLAVRFLQRKAGAMPAAGLPPSASLGPPTGTAPSVGPVAGTGPVPAAAEAAGTLAQLDPFFSVTEQHLRSIVTQTETAAADIIAALQSLDAAQSRSAACVTRTRGRMVGLAGDSEAALHGLAERLNAYLLDRLEGTRGELAAIGGVGEQMHSLDTLTAGLEKIGTATRMLALNANIEASRAGSHGAGFQVIARELQALAQGSQEAIAEARRRVATVQQTVDDVVVAVRGTERTRAEEARIRTMMSDLDGIVGDTTRAITGMAETEFGEIEALSGRVGDQVLTVFGQIQFQDVVRQQIEAVGESVRMLHGLLADLRSTLDGSGPSVQIDPDRLLQAVRARYVTQVQRQTDASTVGAAFTAPEAPMIELF